MQVAFVMDYLDGGEILEYLESTEFIILLKQDHGCFIEKEAKWIFF